jgi:serpin B
MGRFSRVLASGGGLVTLVAGVACSKSPPPPPVCNAPQGSAAEAQGLASADAAFASAFWLPAAAAVGAGQNVILSPYSVTATLTMIDVGASGETDAQIQSVLHLPGNGATVAPAYAALACESETDGTQGGDQLSIANSIWGQQGTSFESSFLSTLSQGYGAPLQQVDYASDATGAASTINRWVSGQTQGMIPSVVDPSDLDATTRLVLVDAVYFKGAWATAFDPSRTSSQPFTLSDGSQVSVPTMAGSVTVRIGSVPGTSVYELGYKDGVLAMDILLPETGTLSSFESALTSNALAAAVASLGAPQSQTEMLLPKFSFQTHLALAPVLGSMGMTDLFQSGVANLSGIDGAEDLYVSAVVQEAVVEVDESGTVAAAATAGTVTATAGGEGPITIDHPFLFLIRDTSSGSILFMGRVENPQSGS